MFTVPKGLFKAIGISNPTGQDQVLTNASLEISATGLNLAVTALEEPRRFVCKRMAEGYSVAFLIPIAINCNRICDASVVRKGGLAIVSFFFWHFPSFFLVEMHTQEVLFYFMELVRNWIKNK